MNTKGKIFNKLGNFLRTTLPNLKKNHSIKKLLELFYMNLISDEEIKNEFHRVYWKSCLTYMPEWNTSYQGIILYKCPFDLWVFQEIIYEVKPEIIIECGTAKGGSALYLANLCDLTEKGLIISIDIENYEHKPQHKRIKYLIGSSVSKEIEEKVNQLINSNDKVMVFLDSNHEKNHVLNELKIYSKFINIGSYIIVEDSNMNGHPVYPNFGPGPMEAIEDFLKENKNFIIDKSREKFLLTFNPKGYLKRIK